MCNSIIYGNANAAGTDANQLVFTNGSSGTIDDSILATGCPTGATCPTDGQRGEARAGLRCDIGAFELQYADSNTVIKSDFAGGVPYSFGPTWISMTLGLADTGLVSLGRRIPWTIRSRTGVIAAFLVIARIRQGPCDELISSITTLASHRSAKVGLPVISLRAGC
jgi:hypothetical protein